MLMTPVFHAVEDYKKAYTDTKYACSSGFAEHTEEHKTALHIIASCAKVFILENYTKVTDWSGLVLRIKEAGETFDYYKHTDWESASTGPIGEEMNRLNEELRKGENPVRTLTDPVLDPTDGDFSITINGKRHFWISDRAVIKIADYIEKSIG